MSSTRIGLDIYDMMPSNEAARIKLFLTANTISDLSVPDQALLFFAHIRLQAIMEVTDNYETWKLIEHEVDHANKRI